MQIRYTLDGSTPTTSSTLYGGTFTVSPGAGPTVTVNVIAVDSLGSTGGVSSATVQGPSIPGPVLSATLVSAAPSGANTYAVSMTVGSPANQIYYQQVDGFAGGATAYARYTSTVTITVLQGDSLTVNAYGTTPRVAPPAPLRSHFRVARVPVAVAADAL